MYVIETKKYFLRNVKTNEIVEGLGFSKEQVCKNLDLKKHNYRVEKIKEIYKDIKAKTNLTNAELIAILSKRPANEEVKINIEMDLWASYGEIERSYHNLNENDGLCYSETENELYLYAGYIEV